MLDGDRQCACGRYTDAVQSYCCAEFVVERLAKAWQCSDVQISSRCGTTVVHPAASPARGRPTLQDVVAIRNAASNGRPQLAVVAFEQCKLTKFTPEDNDINDGVFEVSATSHVDGDALLDYSVLIKPMAFGSTEDAALDIRFGEIGVPAGSRVYVSSVGPEAHTVCYTANSVADESPECPSVAVARVIHSVRATFAANSRIRSNSPINTLSNLPHVESTHVALVVVYPPKGTRAAAANDMRLDFELVYRNEETLCTVHTNGVAKGSSGYAVIVPAPFRWPHEGVPTYLESTDGICVGGDDAGESCTEVQQCPHGYCNMDKKSSAYLKCIDTVRSGVNADSSCSRASQCAYGYCYGYAGSARRGVYPGVKSWLECVGVGCYGASASRNAWCARSSCFGDALAWSTSPDANTANEDLYPLQE